MSNWDHIKSVKTCDAEITRLESECTPKLKNLAQLTYTQTQDLENRYIKPLTELKKRRSVLQGVETRAANRALKKVASGG